MGKKDYDLICQICLDMFNKVGADIKVGERVVGGRCWRCLVDDSEQNPVYRLSPSLQSANQNRQSTQTASEEG